MKTCKLIGFILLAANAAFGLLQGILIYIAGSFGAEALVGVMNILAVVDSILLTAACVLVAIGSLRDDVPAMIVAIVTAATAIAGIILRLALFALSAGILAGAAPFANIAVIVLQGAPFAILLIVLGRKLAAGWRVVSFVAAGFAALSMLASLAINLYVQVGDITGGILSAISGAGNLFTHAANLLCIAFFIGCMLSLRARTAPPAPNAAYSPYQR